MRKSISPGHAVSGLLIVASCLLAGTAQAQEYEQTVTLKASDILPAELVSGPNHKVEPAVINDGFLNIYTVTTPMGSVDAVSTDTLRKYVHEINAAARMQEIRGSKEFMAGIKDKAAGVTEGAKNLVTDPVNTVSSTVSGIGKLFTRAGENLTQGQRSDVEGSRAKDLIGFSKAKRDYAYEFGVDAYSRNPILQQQLDDLSWAGYSGSMAASAALMAVPGGAGAAVSIAGGSTLLSEVFRDMAPVDLRKMNREKLAALGVSGDVNDLFIGNSVYTPREQTLLIDAISSMSGTGGRDAFIKMAVLTGDPDIAHFRQRQAQMYAAFARSMEPLATFVQLGQVAAARTASGKLVFAAPLDHMLWTRAISQFASIVTGDVSLSEGVRERHLYISGSFSPLARKSLEAMGWKLHDNSAALLSGTPD